MKISSKSGISVWVLIIEHAYGRNVSTHRSEAAAVNACAEYAREWWSKERIPGKKPKDPQTLIDRYFEHTQHSIGGDEYYVIEHTILKG